MDINTKKAYELIQKKADSNEMIQAVSSVLGFPYTLLADAGVYFSHYVPMLNAIRKIYGRNPLEEGVIAPILKGCKSEIFADILLDKLIGQIPVVGIAANIMCAKTLTWRLGTLFAMLAAKDSEIREADVIGAVRKIRKEFPQRNMFSFQKPTPTVFDYLVNGGTGSADAFDVDAFFESVVYRKTT